MILLVNRGLEQAKPEYMALPHLLRGLIAVSEGCHDETPPASKTAVDAFTSTIKLSDKSVRHARSPVRDENDGDETWGHREDLDVPRAKIIHLLSRRPFSRSNFLDRIRARAV